MSLSVTWKFKGLNSCTNVHVLSSEVCKCTTQNSDGPATLNDIVVFFSLYTDNKKTLYCSNLLYLIRHGARDIICYVALFFSCCIFWACTGWDPMWPVPSSPSSQCGRPS